MILKYCYNNEIHKAFAHPLTFEALLDDIKSVFNDNIPRSFSLQYQDPEGDLITISTDLEYQSMLVFDLTKSMSAIKIFITPIEEKEKLKPIPLSKALSQESFEVVSDSSNSIIEIGANSLSFSQEDDGASDKAKNESPEKILEQPEGDREDVDSSSPSMEQSSFSETLAKLEARAAALKRQIDFFAQENDEFYTEDIRRDDSRVDYAQSVSQVLPTQYYSLEDSVLSKEVDNAVEELATRTIQRVVRKLIALNQIRDSPYEEGSETPEVKSSFWNHLESKRREAKMVKNNAVVKIQSAFRGYKLRRDLRNYLQYTNEMADLERERRIARTKEQVSELIQKALNFHLYGKPEYENSIEQDTNENIDIHSTTKRCWGFDGMEVKDYRESNYNSEDEDDDGTIYSGGIKPPGQASDKSPASSPTTHQKDDYIKCRLDLSSGGNSLQSPSTAKINEAYQSLRVLEANQTQEFFDYSVMDLGSPRIHLFEDKDGNRVISRTICIENIGTKPWRKCTVKTIGDLQGNEVHVYNVGVGESRLVTLEIVGDFKPGHYISEWRIIHETEHGVMEFVACPFDLAFFIQQEKNEPETQGRQGQLEDKTEDYFYEDNEEVEEEEEEEDGDEDEEEEEFYSPQEKKDKENDEETENDEEEYEEEFEEDSEEEDEKIEENERGENDESDRVFARYLNYREELAKVREIRKLFPSDNLDNILEFVEMKNYLSTDALLMSYWASRKAN